MEAEVVFRMTPDEVNELRNFIEAGRFEMLSRYRHGQEYGCTSQYFNNYLSQFIIAKE